MDSALTSLLNQGSAWVAGGVAATRRGNRHPSIVPYETYEAADRPIAIAVGNDRLFARLCEALGLGELAADERFATNAARVEHRRRARAAARRGVRARARRALGRASCARPPSRSGRSTASTRRSRSPTSSGMEPAEDARRRPADPPAAARRRRAPADPPRPARASTSTATRSAPGCKRPRTTRAALEGGSYVMYRQMRPENLSRLHGVGALPLIDLEDLGAHGAAQVLERPARAPRSRAGAGRGAARRATRACGRGSRASTAPARAAGWRSGSRAGSGGPGRAGRAAAAGRGPACRRAGASSAVAPVGHALVEDHPERRDVEHAAAAGSARAPAPARAGWTRRRRPAGSPA